MSQFVHLHVHTQYSILDGQASIQRLVDKAMADGQPGIAVTDHGDMFGIKEFFNYVKKVRGKYKEKAADCQRQLDDLRREGAPEDAIETCEEQLAQLKRKADFKPIIGCEVYVARRRLQDKEGKPDQSGYHLILLAKNLKGYHNLIKIVSKAWTEGFYMRPRTDRTEIAKHSEGLICCSACLAGEVPRAITADDWERAEESIRWHKSVFGEDYFLELQLHKATVERANHEAYPMQVKVNEGIRKLAEKHGVRTVCTNDVHFVDEDNAEAHDRLICLSTGKDLDDPKRMLYSKQEWLKTTAEMAAIFGKSDPEAMANTVAICDRVEHYSIDHAPIMPTFEIPAEFGTEEEYRARLTEQDLFDEFTRDENGNVVMSEEEGRKKIEKLGGYDKLYRIKFEADYLAHLTMIGAHKRYGEHLTEEQEERLKFELHIMKTMGFPGYFLIVQDFIRAAREELDVSVGPGRGSAAGSAVAYCLGITQIDPIAYDLLFERFLNPDRISLPDIDVDFDDDGRGRVLNWVTQKYGKEKVAHIITYGTMATKLAIKDVARVQKLLLAESDRLCKLVPDKIPDKKLNLQNAIDYVPELKAAEQSDNPVLRDTIRYAKMLEGNVRNTGVHACGTIICRDDITDWVPVSTADDKETGEKMLVTQYEGSVIEDTGLIKMDFLGLKTLSIIKDAVANIRQTKGVEVDIDDFTIIDDKATYKLYGEGRTVGTFQFESAGMQKYLRELQPSTFEDLIAMNALYRPGPMDYIPDFIARKHGRSPIVYDIPVMEKYLKDTYGVTVYQEQVMLLSRLLANFTRGESDTLRKAMGKKLKDKLDALEAQVHQGRAGQRPRSEGVGEDLGRLGEVRLLRLQQIACYVLFVGRLPDGLSQGQLPVGVHGGGVEPQPRERGSADDLHERVQAHGHQGAGTRHQRVDAHLLGQPRGRRALRSGCREGRRRGSRGEHHRRARCGRSVQGRVRLHRAGQLRIGQPQMPRKPRLCRGFRFDHGVPPRQVLRCGCPRCQRRDLHRAADALRPALSGREEQRPAEPLRGRRACGHTAPRTAGLRRLDPARDPLEGARDDRPLPLGPSARRLQGSDRPHVQDAAFGAREPRSAQRAGDRCGGYGGRGAEPHDQDGQAVGQVPSRGLQRRARVRALRQGLREFPQIPLSGLLPLHPRQGAAQALPRFGRAGVQDRLDGAAVGTARHDDPRNRAAAPRGRDHAGSSDDPRKCVKSSKGDTLLRLLVYDPEAGVSVRLFSKSHKVSLTSTLVDYLDANEIRYTIGS